MFDLYQAILGQSPNERVQYGQAPSHRPHIKCINTYHQPFSRTLIYIGSKSFL
jgi:hypothetical protein